MPNKIARILLSAFAILCSVVSFAQQPESASSVQMATGLRSSGKIYVVVAVLVTILTGILLYVIRLDRKISKLEKR